MHALVDFISKEIADPPIIISQRVYLHDFPILIANCYKYGFHDFNAFNRCTFVDSVQLLRNAGYVKPGLDMLCDNLSLSRQYAHSALKDARLLKVVFERLLLHPSQGYSVLDLNSYLCLKMPLPTPLITQWARQYCSSQELQSTLLPFVRTKTALNANQIAKISHL